MTCTRTQRIQTLLQRNTVAINLASFSLLLVILGLSQYGTKAYCRIDSIGTCHLEGRLTDELSNLIRIGMEHHIS